MEVSKEEFGTIYRDHYHKIQSFIYNLTGNCAMTEDLTQETFVKALKEIDSVRDNSRLSVWLNRVAYNLFIDLKRKKGSYTVPIDSSDCADRNTNNGSNTIDWCSDVRVK